MADIGGLQPKCERVRIWGRGARHLIGWGGGSQGECNWSKRELVDVIGGMWEEFCDWSKCVYIGFLLVGSIASESDWGDAGEIL